MSVGESMEAEDEGMEIGYVAWFAFVDAKENDLEVQIAKNSSDISCFDFWYIQPFNRSFIALQ